MAQQLSAGSFSPSPATIDYLNIGLMLLACVVAFFLPFELFLFSYAVLGPLHYLTEISWLHKKKYFIGQQKDVWWLVIFSFALFAVAFFIQDIAHWFRLPLNNLPETQLKWSSLFLFTGFFAAAAFVLFKQWWHKLIALVLIALAGLLARENFNVVVWFGIFLPTIVHVFLFTGLFILFGALKSRSKSGILSLVAFVGCAVSFFLFVPGGKDYTTSEYVVNSYQGFVWLNRELINLFDLSRISEWNRESFRTIFNSGPGLIVMRFIAFAYTYHYLNWFSKTSIIGWHEVNRWWMIAAGVIWAVSVGIYYTDYMTGLKWLFLLSMLHVLLEFPLNVQTIRGIGKELLALGAGKR